MIQYMYNKEYSMNELQELILLPKISHTWKQFVFNDYGEIFILYIYQINDKWKVC